MEIILSFWETSAESACVFRRRFFYFLFLLL